MPNPVILLFINKMEALEVQKVRTDVIAILAMLENLKQMAEENTNSDLFEYNTGYSLGLSHAITAIKSIK